MPVPLRRYVLIGLLAVAGLLGITLLVRPFIFSFASALDDSRYRVVSTSLADAGPQRVEIVLNDSHDLVGEITRDGRVGLVVIVAAVPGGTGYTAVSAWSPAADCAVEFAADRLADCEGATWTYAGVPIDPADPPLQRFLTTERNGAVTVDFTAPIGPGGG